MDPPDRAVHRGLLVGGRWRDVPTEPKSGENDSIEMITAAWNAGHPADRVLRRARLLADRVPDDPAAVHLRMWLELEAGTAELAHLPGDVGPYPPSAALSAATATYLGASHQDVESLPPDHRLVVEVAALLDGGSSSEAVERAAAGTTGADGSSLPWIVRSLAEHRSGRWRDAIHSAIEAWKRDSAAAEPALIIRQVLSRRLIPLAWVGWFLIALGLLAVGAANAEATFQAPRQLVSTLGFGAFLAGGLVLFLRTRIKRSLPNEVQPIASDVARFRYQHPLLMASIALPIMVIVAGGPSQAGVLLLALPGVAILAIGIRGLLRPQVSLRRVGSFALSGLAIHERYRPDGQRNARWRDAKRSAPHAAGDASVDLSN